MFGKKDDPLVGVITGIVNDTARRNEVEKKVNETFGVQSRKALPHERLAEYDAALAAAQGEPQNLTEEQLDELKGETLGKYIQKATLDRAEAKRTGESWQDDARNKKLPGEYRDMAADEGRKDLNRSQRRKKGIDKAIDRLGGKFKIKPQWKKYKLKEDEQLDEVLDTEKKKLAYVKKAKESQDRNRRKANAADLRSDEFLDSAGEPDYNPKRPNRWGINTDIMNRANRKVANRQKGIERALKEMKDARDREIEAAQRAEDEKGGYKTAKEWEKYWREHGDGRMADFSERARKKKLKESSRAEREARRDDYKYKITGSDKEKEKETKERITKTTGYKFKKD